jgi:hypothetical protein
MTSGESMRASSIFAAALVLLLSISGAFVPGCGDESTNPEPTPIGVVPPEHISFKRGPDFSLLDVNTNSPTYSQAVSPRQEQGKVSAWYFGFAT